MATLFDALSDCSFDLQNKRDLSGDFSRKLIAYRDRIVSEYLKTGADLSELISGVSKKENLNDDQIQRIIEEVNNQIYLIKYDKLKGSNEREVDFDIASLAKVKGEIKSETKKEDSGDKVAFETDETFFEKVASSEVTDLFSRNLEYTFGDLSLNSRNNIKDFYLKKVAENIKSREFEIEKIAQKVNHNISELAETFIHLERLNSNPSEIMSSLVKEAKVTDKCLDIIKESITDKIAGYVEKNYLPSTFIVNLDNLNLNKTASEKFNLGSFSFNKTAEINIPTICLSTNKQISDFNGILKIASELKENTEDLKNKNDEYIICREKLASLGIEKCLEDDFFFQNRQE